MGKDLIIKKAALKKLNQHNVKDAKQCPFDGKILNQVSVANVMRKSKRYASSCYSCYRVMTTPVRMLLSIPVTAFKVVQENVFPEILLTEGHYILRNHFGFSRDKMLNNAILGGMLSFSLVNLWINPWLDEKHAEIDAIWYKAPNMSIPNDEYMAEFYSATLKFAGVLGLHVLCEIGNHICEFLLKTAITLKSQIAFVREWLTNDSAYGVKTHNVFSGTERDEEKANLNSVNLFQDLENTGDLTIASINSRINTIVDCGTAFSMLAMMSPSIALELFGFRIILPQLIVLSFIYSMVINVALMIFEKPMNYCYERMQHYKDKLIYQIINVEKNAELISFTKGAENEEDILLRLLNIEYNHARKYEGINASRLAFEVAIKHFEWLVPIFAIIPLVRSGILSQEMVGPIMSNFMRVSLFLMWSKHNFQNLQKLIVSKLRWSLFQERMKAWKIKRDEIEKKIFDSDTISLKGSIYLDEDKKNIIGKGEINLTSGSITHFNAPSGTGKTTVLRCLCGLHDFDGKITLPREYTVFLPSQPYILRAAEEIQKILKSKPEIIDYIKIVFEKLNMPDRVIKGLMQIPVSSNQDINNLNTASWMDTLSDGEPKRVAFALLLFRLKTEKILFANLDEPFKGIDLPTQIIMVELLRDAIAKLEHEGIPDGPSAGCTILFSNHEQNHGLNTHVLTIDEKKEFKWEPAKKGNKGKEELKV